VSDTALWFGPEERARFGWLSVPPGGRARGAVVLCPPLGLEGACAHRTYIALQEDLTARGFCVLRLDYDGTGDSTGGSQDPGRLDAWVTSVGDAMDLVRHAGAGQVGVVGMRMGATLASVAAARAPAEALVLWDPCVTGRAYLRQQRALRALSLEQATRDDGSVEAPGVTYGPDTVAQLSALEVGGGGTPSVGRWLVLTRPGADPHRLLVERLSGAEVDWARAEGQPDLVDVEPFAAVVPRETMDRVVAWLDTVLDTNDSVIAPPRGVTPVVGRRADGLPLVERALRFGSTGLFGVVTEPEGQDDLGTGPTLVLLNSGIVSHVGPGRLWVDMGRRMALGGMRVVRFDLSGLGDSPPRPGRPVDVTYPPEAFDDLADALPAISPHDPTEVVLAGLCSGGYHAIEGALAFGARGVCLINPILTTHPSEIRADDDKEGRAALDPRRRATGARKRWVRALPAHDTIGFVVDRLPDAAWWMINRLAVENPPACVLGRLVEMGVDTFVVCGEREARLIRRGQAAALRRLTRTGAFRLEVVPGIDHELFAHAARECVTPIVEAHVLDRFVPARAGAELARP